MPKRLRLQLMNRRDRLGLTLQGWLLGLAFLGVVFWVYLAMRMGSSR